MASSTRKNAMYNVAYRLFSVLLPLVTAPYLSRTVGTEGVGLYSHAWSVSYIFCLIGMLGLNDYGVRAIARVRDDREKLDRTFSAIWQMQLLVAGVTLLLWFGYVFLVAGEERTIAFHLTMMSVSCLCSFDWCLMGLDIFRPIALRNTFVKSAAAVCVFLFVREKGDLWIYAFVWSLATLAGNLSCVPGLRGKVRYRRVPMGESLKHLGPCAVLFISVMAVNIYRTMDKVMVSRLAGYAQNGLYENAEKIIYCLSGFISAIGTVMMPKISHMQQKGETEAIRAHIDRSMELILCMVSGMAFGVAAVADRFSVLFYGEAFAASGALMAPLAFTLILIGFANVIRTQWVLPQGRDSIFVKSVCSGAVVNLAVNALLIPRMQAMGAVVGTLMAEGTVPLVQWLILRRELPYGRFLGYAGTYAAAGAVMLLAVRLTGRLLPWTGWPGLAAQVAVGILVYGAVTLLVWKLEGRTYLRGLGRKKTKSGAAEAPADEKPES
ncbi:MAG: flippase [Clostridia bacterium]|nr:flippase [Clostridia bacterium]